MMSSFSSCTTAPTLPSMSYPRILHDGRLTGNRIGHAVSSRKRVDILAKAKALGVKVTNPKGRVTTEA